MSKTHLVAGVVSAVQIGFQLGSMPNSHALVDAIKSTEPYADTLILNFFRELQGRECHDLDSVMRDLVRRSERKSKL